MCRNMYRNMPEAYALDQKAVKLARAMMVSICRRPFHMLADLASHVGNNHVCLGFFVAGQGLKSFSVVTLQMQAGPVICRL